VFTGEPQGLQDYCENKKEKKKKDYERLCQALYNGSIRRDPKDRAIL